MRPLSASISARSRARLAGASLSLLLAGCAVGPDYAPPAAPAGENYETAPLPPATQKADSREGNAQRFAVGADLPGEWWTLFRSSALDQLIRQALAANPDLRAAEAALRQAQELAAAQRGGLLPAVDASAGRSRNRVSGAASGLPAFSSLFNLNNASVAVSYDVDVFGGTRRAIESAEAQAEYQRWQREAAILSLTANIVTTALQEASLRAQIKATREIIDAEAEQLRVVENQFILGGAAKTDVLAQQSLLAQSRASLPPLEKQLEQQRHLLATLAGRAPAQGIEGEFDLDSLNLPGDLPVSLPARLAEQRPDIKAAAATLHQASAEVGVAIANQWPKLTLTASYGTAANTFGQLFSAGAAMWAVGGGVTQPIFEGGALGHKRAAAEAGFDLARAQYESTVLNALRNVADSLRALQSDAETLTQQVAYARSAADSLNLAKQRFAYGAISHLSLLDAERTEAQARIGLIQARAARLADTAALFQALGGGWWNRPDTAPQPPDLIAPLL
jgi:NodT family efflux transporter outer membrane factor (OMF) lipoprotein